MRKLIALLSLLALLVVPAFAQDDEGEEMTMEDTIADLVVASTEGEEPEFTVLLAALVEAELVDAVADPEAELTVFAPTDAAFGALLEALEVEAADLLAREDLADILLYHVVAGAVFAETVVTLDGESVETLQGGSIEISLGETEDGETAVFLNEDIQVITTDIEAANGVIHVIDGVLLPPAEEEMDGDTEEEMDGDMGEMSNTIADVVVASTEAEEPEFTVLLAALMEAELVDAVADPEAELTVFAPTDAAFGALLEALEVEAADLLAREDLADILLYHVVAGAVLAETVVTLDGEEVETLQGSTISISVTDEGVFLNDDVQVIQTDIETDNGVIHVIDAVLLPPAEEEE